MTLITPAANDVQKDALKSSTGGRAIWLEVARVVATFVVVLEHMPYGTRQNLYSPLFLGAPIFFFFFLSGFMTGRKGFLQGQCLDWRRTLTLLIPFLAWQTLLMAAVMISGRMFNGVLLKTADFKVILYYLFSLPIDPPLWFLRDLLALTLISPFLLRFRKLLLFLGLACCLLNDCLGPQSFLPPFAWGGFAIGLALNDRSIENLRRFSKQTASFSLAAMVLLSAAIVIFQRERESGGMFLAMFHGGSYGVLPSVVGVLAILSAGVWIEDNFPQLARRIAPVGLSSFLIYAAHYPLIAFAGTLLRFEPTKRILRWGGFSYPYTLALALIICLFGYLFYLALRRWTPWLLPIFAAQPPPKKNAH